MPNPKKRHTHHRTGSRRAKNWTLTPVGISRCANCGATTRSHAVCAGCGFYDGKLAVAVKVKKSKKKPQDGESGEEKRD